MGAPTEVYYDPVGGSDTIGDGSQGNPYQTLQYALDQQTAGGTGHYFRQKAGTTNTLAAALDWTAYGSPTYGARVIFGRYGSGNAPVIDGNGIYAVNATAKDAIHWRDLTLQNSGSATILTVGAYSSAVNCTIQNTTGTGIVLGSYSVACNCAVENIGTNGINANATSSRVIRCYLKNGTNQFSAALYMGSYTEATANIFSVDGTTNGIEISGHGVHVAHNSVRSSSGTGAAIYVLSATRSAIMIYNNIVEGFSGVGGRGIDLGSTSRILTLYANNAAYNNVTNYANEGDGVSSFQGDGNETLASAPFALSGSDTFANRGTYFEPNDVGSLRGGAWPTPLRRDKGAVQHADPAGGGGTTVPQGLHPIELGITA